ncbi:hypothetical protein BGZ72_008071 [Mortierella alpina]|nr:hypothetical protein BGZ72_008071 [Mortierella alpina]
MKPMYLFELNRVGGPAVEVLSSRDAIALVFKGTNTSSYEELVTDATVHRNNNKYLPGEINQGFYMSLFGECKQPEKYYAHLLRGPANAMKDIMERILVVAIHRRQEQEDAIMARLQTIVERGDPVLDNWNPIDDEPDCYTFGSPRVGNTVFAEAFASNQKISLSSSPYKPAYWRIAKEFDPGKI